MVYRRFFVLTIGIAFTTQISSAEEIRMSFGSTIPPYSFSESDNGIEVDIIREALASQGHELTTVFVPPRRIAFEFTNGRVDAASKDQGVDLSKAGFYGEAAVEYFDVVHVLAESDLVLNEPDDLSGLRIAAFENAAIHYPDWLARVSEEEGYQELPDPRLQVKMLHAGRVDVMVADLYIVQHLTNELAAEGELEIKPTVIKKIAEPWGYRPIFRSEAIRDAFNDGLAQITSSGRYQEVIDSYLKK